MAKVLLADDEPDIRKLLKDTLSFAGHDVKEAADGAEALIGACQEHPDIIILDVSMPMMDGFQVLETLRNNPDTEAIPVILLTNLPPARGEKAGTRLGVTHYLTKPWEPGAVETAIRVAMRETKNAPKSLGQVKDH